MISTRLARDCRTIAPAPRFGEATIPPGQATRQFGSSSSVPVTNYFGVFCIISIRYDPTSSVPVTIYSNIYRFISISYGSGNAVYERRLSNILKYQKHPGNNWCPVPNK
jgi:hypothetical protein